MFFQSEETPRQKFERLIEAKIEGVEKTLQILANLSNYYQYKYYEGDLFDIFERIDMAYDRTKQKFTDGLRKAERLHLKRVRRKRGGDDGSSQDRSCRDRT